MTNGPQYYRGQNELAYDIGEQSNSQYSFNKLDRGFNWLFQNGSSAAGVLGRIDPFASGGTVYI